MKSNYEQSSSRTFLEYSFQMKWHHEQYKPVPQSCAVLKEKWLQQMLPKSSKDWFMYSHNCTFISETVYHIVCQILIVQLPAKIFSLFGYCTHWMTSRNIQNGGPQVWSYFLFFLFADQQNKKKYDTKGLSWMQLMWVAFRLKTTCKMTDFALAQKRATSLGTF